jgi:hypothetical protein
MSMATTTSTDLTTLTPVEIDTVLSDLWGKIQKWATYLASEKSYLGRARSDRDRDEIKERMARYQEEIRTLKAEAKPYEDEFDRRPWLRYFLVTNGNGHVHRGMNCNTCFDTTSYSWLVDLADCDEAAMVAEHGEQACTVCFPEAPTMKGFGDGTSKVARKTAEEKAARVAAKAEREAKKFAKDLQPHLVFTDLMDWKVRTVAGAKEALRKAVECKVLAGTRADYNGYSTSRLDKADMVESDATHALLEKGLTSAEIAIIIERAAKKTRKDYSL